MLIFNNMSIELTYFPHGTSTDNEKGISSGWSDVDLSEIGKRQITELKQIICDRHFDAAFCSDLKRANNTAIILFEGIPAVIPDIRLRECNYGEYNGQPASMVEPLQREHIFNKFPGGESYEDVKDRIKDFLDFLKENYDGKSIAIISHKAPQLTFEVLLNNKTWDQAFDEDWRKTNSWQPGWGYSIHP